MHCKIVIMLFKSVYQPWPFCTTVGPYESNFHLCTKESFPADIMPFQVLHFLFLEAWSSDSPETGTSDVKGGMRAMSALLLSCQLRCAHCFKFACGPEDMSESESSSILATGHLKATAQHSSRPYSDFRGPSPWQSLGHDSGNRKPSTWKRLTPTGKLSFHGWKLLSYGPTVEQKCQIWRLIDTLSGCSIWSFGTFVDLPK